MIWREDQLRQVQQALAEPGAAVRLIGMPGSGVSTLALNVCNRFRGPRFNLGGESAIEHLQVALGGPPASRLSRLGPCLLVLDHPTPSPAPDLREHLEIWRASSPELRVLLACPGPPLLGERRVELMPLNDRHISEWLKVEYPDVVVSDSLFPLLDGHGLAWVQAARRLRDVPAAELSGQLLADPFAALRDPTAPGEQPLEVALERWWSNLREDDRKALVALSAFAGSFGRDGAQRILDVGPDETLDTLQALRFCAALAPYPAAQPRFRVPLWIRRWVRVQDQEGYRRAQDRLMTWLCTRLHEIGPEPHLDPRGALREWATERETLTGPFLEQHPDPRSVYLARIAADVAILHPAIGELPRARQLFSLMLHHPIGAAKDRQRIAASLAYLAIREGNFDEAREVLDRAPPGPPGTSLASIRTQLGDTLLLGGRLEEAAVAYAEAKAEAEACSSWSDAASASQQLGVTLVRLNRKVEALEATARAVDLVDACSPSQRAKIWQNAAFVYTMLDRLDDAEASTLGALRLFEASGAAKHIAVSKLQLGALAARRGRATTARDWLRQAADAFSKTSDLRLLYCAKAEDACLDLTSDPASAAHQLEACASALEEAGFSDHVAQFRAMGALGWVLAGAGDRARPLLARLHGESGTTNDQGKAIGHFVAAALALAGAPDAADRADELDLLLAAIPDRGRHRLMDESLDALRHYVYEGRGATWVSRRGDLVRTPGGTATKVHGANARILRILVERRPDALGVAQLAAAGWPDESLDLDTASLRVRVALHTLRTAGLRDGLERLEKGWRLNPDHLLRILDEVKDLPPGGLDPG